MHELCHRCHGEIPEVPGSSRGDDDAVLFCPRCGAPQIHLQEHMHAEAPAADAVPTTGAVPPPRPPGAAGLPGRIDWEAALVCTGLVAVVAASLAAIGIESIPVAFVGALWTISGAVIAIRLYNRRRPQAWMDARIGLRIGVAAGLLIVAATCVTAATAGVVMRFGTHSMAKFDEENAQERKALQTRIIAWFDQNVQDKDMQQRYAEEMNSPQMNSPEMLAGSALFGRALQGFFILAISALGGAFAGRLLTSHTGHPRLRRGD